MSFFISDAFAQGPATPSPSPGGGLLSFLPLLVIFVIFYFLLIRPQTKRAKDHKAMIDALAKGDEVVTSGGVAGRITALGDTFVTMEIADNVSVKVQRSSVQTVLPKGTLKSA